MHSIISLIIDLPPRCSRGLRTVCCHCWHWRVPFESQGEASVSYVGGERVADHEACILKPSPTAEVKQARLSLQSRLPWESLGRKIHATVGEEKRRSKFVIEHSRSHSVLVFKILFHHRLHLNFKSDTYSTCRLGFITLHIIIMCHLLNEWFPSWLCKSDYDSATRDSEI